MRGGSQRDRLVDDLTGDHEEDQQTVHVDNESEHVVGLIEVDVVLIAGRGLGRGRVRGTRAARPSIESRRFRRG